MTRRHRQQLINSLIHSDGGSKPRQLNADTDRAFVLLSAALPRWTPLGHERRQVRGIFVSSTAADSMFGLFGLREEMRIRRGGSLITKAGRLY